MSEVLHLECIDDSQVKHFGCIHEYRFKYFECTHGFQVKHSGCILDHVTAESCILIQNAFMILKSKGASTNTDSNIFECIHSHVEHSGCIQVPIRTFLNAFMTQLKHFRCTYEYRFKLLNACMILESNILRASKGTDSNILIAPKTMIVNTIIVGCFTHFERIHNLKSSKTFRVHA